MFLLWFSFTEMNYACIFAGLCVMFWFLLKPVNIDVPLNSTHSIELLDFKEIHIVFS